MIDTSEYKKRAEGCIRKAETASSAADRAGWLKLAADWTRLSEISFRAVFEKVEREGSR
jgi:hypothetical protein